MRAGERQRVHAGDASVPEPLGAALFRLFGATSRALSARTFHPTGTTYEAELAVFAPELLRDTPLFARERPYAALVRFSRAFGLPPPLPDFLGVALRLVDVHGTGLHQDLLFATSLPGAAGKYVPAPTTDLFRRPLSTLLPYRAGEARVLFGVRPVQRRQPDGSPLDQLRSGAASGSLRIVLAVARLGAPWEALGVVTLGRELAPETSRSLRFDPWNTGGGVVPVGLLNRLRRPAYLGSQRGRRAS